MRCGYGLQIYSNTNSFVMFTGYICEAGGSHTMET